MPENDDQQEEYTELDNALETRIESQSIALKTASDSISTTWQTKAATGQIKASGTLANNTATNDAGEALNYITHQCSEISKAPITKSGNDTRQTKAELMPELIKSIGNFQSTDDALTAGMKRLSESARELETDLINMNNVVALYELREKISNKDMHIGLDYDNGPAVGSTNIDGELISTANQGRYPGIQRIRELSGELTQNLELITPKGLKKAQKTVLQLLNETELFISENPELNDDVAELETLVKQLQPKLLAVAQVPAVEAILDGIRPSSSQGLPGDEMAQKLEVEAILDGITQPGELTQDLFITPLGDSTGVDPITAAIRENIIEQQQEAIKQEIAKTLSGDTQTQFINASWQDIYADAANKEAISKAMGSKELQQTLNDIEQKGYETVGKQFSESFSNVKWTHQEGGSQGRTVNITNDDGNHVCDLKETLVKNPKPFISSDGTEVQVTGYRQIDFPISIDENSGPLHLSMALKDENGKNMPKNGAVYFTAHYDQAGKLTEMSSPIPVKFMGKGDDAIGYIEREGKIYTLPVTKATYTAMMQEVEVNHGMSTDISQDALKNVSREKSLQDSVKGAVQKVVAGTHNAAGEPVSSAVKQAASKAQENLENNPLPTTIMPPLGQGTGKGKQTDKVAIGI